jgi:hypothetical protein
MLYNFKEIWDSQISLKSNRFLHRNDVKNATYQRYNMLTMKPKKKKKIIPKKRFLNFWKDASFLLNRKIVFLLKVFIQH